MLSCFSKLIEKASIDQLVDYTNRELPNDNQFAFKQNNSCLHPILLTRHIIETELEKGKYVCMVQVDLSIAFETPDCALILPSKMRHFGFTEKTINFYKSFLMGRHHYTDWKGTKSEPIPLFNHSCVQGSSVGAILFNLYTQDLQSITDCYCICFADDVNLILSDDDPNELLKK